MTPATSGARASVAIGLVAAVAILAAGGCRKRSAAPDEETIEATPDPASAGPSPPQLGAHLEAGETFASRLLVIAGQYRRYRRMEVMPRWAPMPCAPSRRPPTGDMYRSDTDDEATHGRKLYYLYATFPDHYAGDVAHEGDAVPSAPLGQTVVKEAWTAVEVAADPESYAPLPPAHAREGGKVYRAGEKAGLFVMTKLDPRTPGTDLGWLYGVVSADGSAVVEAGRLEQCMRCHRNASGDRLFGFNR